MPQAENIAPLRSPRDQSFHRIFDSPVIKMAQEGIAGAEWKESERRLLSTLCHWENPVYDFVRGAVSADRNELAVAFAPGLAGDVGGLTGGWSFTGIDLQSC